MAKRKIISMVLAAAVMATIPMSVTISANDDALSSLVSQGVMEGDENGDLNADASVTRAEFAKMLCKADLVSADAGTKTASFADVSPAYWGYEYINTLYGAGAINGYPDGNFHPEDNITLMQAVRIVGAALGNSRSDPDTQCASYAIDNNLLINVSTRFSETLTRKDAAEIINNAMTEKTADAAYNTKNKYAFQSPVMSSSNTSKSTNSAAVSSASGSGGGSAYSPAAESAVSSGVISVPPYYGGYYPLDQDTEEYTQEEENIFKDSSTSPLSTFSIDTDTASYSNMRRFILEGKYPEKGSIRSEELINYFTYNNEKPQGDDVFALTTETAQCPWNDKNLLTRISVQGADINAEERKPQNLVFLLDVSGSMYSEKKLPLVKRSMLLLLDTLDERDTISIVTYASGTQVVLPSTNAGEKDTIKAAVTSLSAGGSTSGAAGLQLAYDEAAKNKIEGNNRIILCTDGDFNVGITSDSDLKTLVSGKRDEGIYLSILGFGMGNYKDSKLEIMADNGNGNYYYIDNFAEAKKVLVNEMTKTLYTIAKDVKLQVEFNPETVSQYRLVGYENRTLQSEDFANDKKDAGELGAGGTVTALYEIVPKTADSGATDTDLKYQTSQTTGSKDLMNVKVRYKLPAADESILKEFPVANEIITPSADFNFAAAAAETGMVINNSAFKGTATLDSAAALAAGSRGNDEFGYRSEFVNLLDLLKMIDPNAKDDDGIIIYPTDPIYQNAAQNK